MREESGLLQKIYSEKVPEIVMETVTALQDIEREEFQRLDAIKRAIKEGQTVSKYEIRHVFGRYEKLQQETEYEKKVQWTMDVIKQLQQSKIGNFVWLDEIKNRLEEGIILDNEEINYLKENWQVLKKIKQ